MSLRLRDDSLRNYLRERAEETNLVPKDTPDGVCILSGQILRENLTEWLNRESIPKRPVTTLTTIEELAGDLLQAADKPARILPDSIRDRFIEQILLAADPEMNPSLDALSQNTSLGHDEEAALTELATVLPYMQDDTREALLTEFDDFLRWTDATKDMRHAIRAVGGLETEYNQSRSLRMTDACQGISDIMTARLAAHSLEIFPSRSHLVTAARNYVDTQWRDVFGDVDWVAVGGISVLDNPTLRLLETIAEDEAAPDVELFVNTGSSEYNAARVTALDTGVDARMQEDSGPTFAARASQQLFDATQGDVGTSPDASFVETPTDRRAVEEVGVDIRGKLADGISPEEILIIARDAGEYEALLESVFADLDLPVFVQTRQAMADIPAYRCLQTLIEIVTAVATDEPIPYGTLVDPLRLGYCEPGAQGNRWPITGREFTKIEQELQRQQRTFNREHDRYEDLGLSLDQWRNAVDDIPAFTADWDAVETYFDRIESLAYGAPATGDELVEVLSPILGTYVYQTVDHRRQMTDAPAVDLTREAITEPHATSLAEQLRSQIDAVGDHYDQLQRLFDLTPGWEEAERAFGAVLGGDTFGNQHKDADAIPVVDAGNAYFRETHHLYLLGMDAETFPTTPSSRTFLPSPLRHQVAESARSGDSPRPHLDSSETMYGESLDVYEAALATASDDATVTLVHTYRDSQGNRIAWSPFVDLFDVQGDDSDTLVDRVSVQSILSEPGGTADGIAQSWEPVIQHSSPRQRLRQLLYHANRAFPTTDPAVDTTTLRDLRGQISESVLETHVFPRLNRYQSPPTAITVDPNEPAFSTTDLEEVVGEPFESHELDLHGQCGLKYHFYQLLFNFEGKPPDRDTIPNYHADGPHHRLGDIPALVRDQYTDPRYVDKWKHIITEFLPDRQSEMNGLAQFDDPTAVRRWVADTEFFEEYDSRTVAQNLVGEWQLVQQERAASVSRDWGWQSSRSVDIDGTALRVPAHRMDTIRTNGNEYVVPIFFARHSGAAESGLKACFNGAIWTVDETASELCLECGNCERCSRGAKYALDHRMLAGFERARQSGSDSVIGIGLQEQYAGPEEGGRVVAMRNQLMDTIQPFESDGLIEQLAGRGFKDNWLEATEQWREAFLSQADELDPSTQITLAANPDLVNKDQCNDCVYSGLCRVPATEDDI